jgi:putative aldouronate transport system permease protein
VQKWNSWFQESIYLVKSRNLWPLQLFMREILVQNDSKMITQSEAAGMANLLKQLVKHCVTAVGTLPILLVYPFAQKYFVKGVTLGGIKE